MQQDMPTLISYRLLAMAAGCIAAVGLVVAGPMVAAPADSHPDSAILADVGWDSPSA